MQPSTHISRSILALVAMAAPSLGQTTWIVDDSGGPGVHFLDVQSALFAAAPGDLILVADGTYQGFVVRRSVRILAEPGTAVTSRVQVLLVSDPTPVVLAGFELQSLELLACASTVALVDLELADDLTVTSCTDVRVFGASASTAGVLVDVRSSRFEVVQSTFLGRDGAYATVCGGVPDAGHPALVHSNSTLLAALSELRGGRGGNAHTFGCISVCARPGGDGGAGIAGSGSVVVITGDGGVHLSGGEIGYGCPDGNFGPCIEQSGGLLRYSGIVCAHGVVATGAVVATPTRDPSLELVGTPGPGRIVEVIVHGIPGDMAQLHLGRAPVVVAQPGSSVEQLVSTGRVVNLGPLPPSGSVRLPLALPSNWPVGTLFWLQASTTDAVGTQQNTSSAPLLLR